MTPSTQAPVLPAGVRAALLEKHTEGPRFLNPGACAPVYANDVRADASANEVTLTFGLVNGGQPPEPATVVEASKVVFSWPMLEMLASTCLQLLSQGGAMRIEALTKQLEGLQQAVGEQVAADG